ncbi:MAG: glycoside hydrolase family 5 protein [Planctomycetota bacterium]|jgi:endoglucanase
MAFDIRRGTNVSHWLSQSDRRGEERLKYFTLEDVERLAGLGFDHLRIPVDEEQLWDDKARPEEEAFELLDKALDWCAACGLRAVVDLHILRSHDFNSDEKPLWTDAAAQERFIACWREISRRLASRPVERIAYELMNEPVADDPDQWNDVALRAIAALRKLEPDRVIVLGSNRWNSCETFADLAVPEDDRVILTFHCYNPFLLTHHQAKWTRVGAYKGLVHYPGRSVAEADLEGLPDDLRGQVEGANGFFGRGALADLMEGPMEVAETEGLPLYCGEWGCIHSAPRADRLRWYADMVRVLEDRDIGWATWDYKGGFGIVKDGEVDSELAGVLLG